MAKLGYTWYPKDWKTNEKVFDMRLELRGFYREMIDFGYENDNKFEFDVKYWSRMLPVRAQKLTLLMQELVNIGVVVNVHETYSIPSIEARMQLIRGGKSGGEKSKPPSKPTPKPIGKPDRKQIESKRESKINIEFDLFWDLYDKKTGDKKKLKTKWEKLTNEDRENIMLYIPKYKLSQPNKKFRLNPQTFFNNEGWNDEIIGEDQPKLRTYEQYYIDQNLMGFYNFAYGKRGYLLGFKKPITRKQMDDINSRGLVVDIIFNKISTEQLNVNHSLYETFIAQL